ncbi:S8 family peptidase [Actinophytocola oryzae]|uniref:Subtilase family protein n=1 Tax=Actinophytocola oryzae TaxID=502181 RepID=A0A4R7W649_9PSEU|nr:S8/S53 family peptidase [Actinophytocola oryzae]TDV57489.1 subtilase family protein [Actinophytocola oryzae]
MPQYDRNRNVEDRQGGIQAISRAQFAAIERAAEQEQVRFESEPANGSPTHIWQKDHLLVSGDVVEYGIEGLSRFATEPVRHLDGTEQSNAPGRARLLRINENEGRSAWQVAAYLNSQRGLAGKVAVNNVVHVAHQDGANLCPADEPVPGRPFPETIPYPPPMAGDAGLGVRVEVVDTGLSPGWSANHPWLHVDGRAAEVSGDREDGTYRPDGRIAAHAGHGTFIAGIVRCVAPGATVHVSNTLRWAGAMLESEVARAIIDAADRSPAPHVINLSAGFVPMHDHAEKSAPLALGMLDVMRHLTRRGCRTLLVAAAGNDGKGPDDVWFYPAAFAGEKEFDDVVVAVGALQQDREGRACFSNFGDWVTVYEDGEKLVNAFPEGMFRYQEPLLGKDASVCVYGDPPLYDGCSCVTAPQQGTVVRSRGMAEWSGTSFAAPVVVGRLAERMSHRFADRPRAAMQDLLKDTIEIKDAGDRVRLPIFPRPVGG